MKRFSLGLLGCVAAGLLVGAAGLMGQSRASVPATAPAASAATQAGQLRLPTYGLSFVPPAGWIVDPDVDADTGCRFLKLDPTTHAKLGEITIAAGPSPNPGAPLSEIARQMMAAKTSPGAQVLPQSFAIDQAPTVAVRKDQGSLSAPAFLLFLTQRPDLVYWFSARGLRESFGPELVAMCKTVQWIPREEMEDHLDLPEKPRILDQTRLQMRLPAIFHRRPGKDVLGVRSDRYGVPNLETGKPLAFLDIQRYPASLTGDDPVEKQLAASIKSLSPGVDPHLEKLNPPQLGAQSDYFACEPSEGGRRIGHCRVAKIVQGKECVLIMMNIVSQDETRLKKWSGMFSEMVKSVQFPE